MKKNLSRFAIFPLWMAVFLLMSVTGCKKSDSVAPLPYDAATQQKLQQMTDGLLAGFKAQFPDYPGGLALQVVTGKGSWFVSSGMGAGVTGGVHFRAASNTKSFTCAAILLLAQRGKLNVDAKITDTIPGTTIPYVPDSPEYRIPFKEQITIRQLMRHRAGVFDITNGVIPDTVSAPVPYKGQTYLTYVMDTDPEHTFTFDELVGVVSTCRLYNFQPGAGYHYSNTGYSLLGKIIERVSGKTYGEFLTSEIALPMGLKQTTFPWRGSDQSIPAAFVPGYYFIPDTTAEVTLSNMSGNVAEGNMITTPEELAHYLRTLLRGEGVLNAYWVNKVMLVPQAGSAEGDGYGCGMENIMNMGFGHSGAHDGYLSRMASDPATDFTVVAFTNAWEFSNGLTSLKYQFNNLIDEACYRAKSIVK